MESEALILALADAVTMATGSRGLQLKHQKHMNKFPAQSQSFPLTYLEAVVSGVIAGRALVGSSGPGRPCREQLPLLLGHDRWRRAGIVICGRGALSRWRQVDRRWSGTICGVSAATAADAAEGGGGGVEGGVIAAAGRTIVL